MNFQLIENFVWINAKIKGNNFKGIPDSDSDETYIDTEAAERLRFKPRLYESHQASRKQSQKTIQDSIPFLLDMTTLAPARVNVIPLQKRFPGMDFILGFDALGKTPFTLDYSRNQFILGTIPHSDRIEFLPQSDVPSTTLRLGTLMTNAVVDTGAPAGLDLSYGWVKSNLPLVELGRPIERRDLGPNYEAFPFMVDEVAIGDKVKLTKVEADAIRHKTDPSKDPAGDRATVGNKFLKRFSQVGIDGQNRSCVFQF